ncbi:MAG: NADH-quinone oxidoreductase subunit NuoE [Anaeromicrobium sp.]|jgi:NADH-quinone oxidoreductase subunit E|uniref:NADH-quinone oxidoreductase subunit NuoE n=1 Tax=Anaeromicrobium sp. TaxID=1929132 RepID=UPI0025F5D5CF|nr:NADH-quinone oxidoreductase subunit NuoE [Anaeromicrobium sp.]MCT4595773.1 NADH-quinone oxidoreductase subunit NuoE [Anaeromicrobium sp.]
MSKTLLCDENLKKLDHAIEENRRKKGALIPILNEAQRIFGCLPLEVQKKISEELNIPLSEVYGVVTFYSQFTLEPRGEYTIGVCLGTACYVKGSQNILDKIKGELKIDVGETSKDGKFTLEATRCIGACGLAPVIMINDHVYGRLVEDDIPHILKKY